MSDIQFGKALKTGSAVPDTKLSVGGGIKIGGGGSAPVVEAAWGQIQGNIESQEDLIDLFDAVGDELDDLAAAVDTKLTTPSGTNGQYLSLVNGVWTAVDLPVYEGGVN